MSADEQSSLPDWGSNETGEQEKEECKAPGCSVMVKPSGWPTHLASDECNSTAKGSPFE